MKDCWQKYFNNKNENNYSDADYKTTREAVRRKVISDKNKKWTGFWEKMELDSKYDNQKLFYSILKTLRKGEL